MDALSLSSFAARLHRLIPAESNGNIQAAFGEHALELFALQFEYNPVYARFCKSRGISPDNIGSWQEIPAISTVAFKEMELTSLAPDSRTAVFHSSGTTGHQPSKHFHSKESLELYEASVLGGFSRHRARLKCLQFLTPPPQQAPNSSLVHMFETIRRELGNEGSRFLGQADAAGWTFDFDATKAALKDASERAEPLFLMGAVFSFVHLTDYLAKEKIRFQFPEGSAALETGGYKGRSRTLSKPSLRALIRNYFGIPEMRIISEYGMSELSSQAYDKFLDSTPSDAPGKAAAAATVFRFPPWARAIVISPETGREVEDGQTGLLRILDLANVYSVMAIQTEDLGIRRGDGFELSGRPAIAETRGCSLMTV